MGEPLFEAEQKKRRDALLQGLHYGDETPASLVAFKNALLKPQMPVLKGREEEEGIFHSMLTKDVGTSNLKDWELYRFEMLDTTHSLARMMKLDLLAAFLAQEASYGLNLAKSRKGWQQDKFNEIRTDYNVKNTDLRSEAERAVGPK
jgi:hypothetical protein